MTKAEFIDANARSADGTPSSHSFVVLVTAEVVSGVAFGRSGLGPTDAEHPEVRPGRTQRTGETVKIAATTRMISSAGSTLTAA